MATVQEGKAYIHAALALYYAGKEINEDNLKKVVEALGIGADDAKIKMVVASLSEINLEETLKSATMTAAIAAPAAAPVASTETEEKEEKKEEEKEEEKKEEVDISEGLAGLFG